MGTGTGPGTRLIDMQLGPLVVVRRDATLMDAAQAMMRTGVSAVIVGDRDTIVTERDLVDALARGRPSVDHALNAATVNPWSIHASETVLDALTAMVRHGVRHLVVLDQAGDPVGVAALAATAEAALGDTDVPHWLTGFRLALHRETSRHDVGLFET